MRKLSHFIFWIGLIMPSILSAKTVTIVAVTPFLTPANSSIFLTGDLPGRCNWQADCVKMSQIEPGIYSAQIEVPNNQNEIVYKITRGSWETEAADSYSRPYDNSIVKMDETDSPVVLDIIHWKDLAPLSKGPNVTGPFSLYSKELGVNKEISVYLPPDYKNSTKNYPVIYMHDGQNVFDPTTSSFGKEWAIDETMDVLIKNKQIPEAIVVAIHTNNEDRYDEYDYFIKGKQYSDFLANSVIPFTEKNFRAIKNKKSRSMMGSSMGALISLMILIDRPDLFSKAAALSFPANIDERAIFRFMENRTLPEFSFYMDHGNQDLDSRYAPAAQELYKTLLSKGLKASQLNYQIFPYTGHSESSWARRAHIPLKYLLK